MVTIGQANLFQVGCKIGNVQSIGDYNVFEVRSQVGAKIKGVGNGCVIGSTVSLVDADNPAMFSPAIPPGSFHLEDGTVVYSIDGVAHLRTGNKLQEQHRLQISRYRSAMQDEQSKSALKNYHKLR